MLDYAIRIGLKYIAVTDHDTLEGAGKAAEAGKNRPITVISGAELSTRDEETGRNVHLLCYLPEDAKGLCQFMNETLKNRRRQKLAMAEKIYHIYPAFEVDAVERQAKESMSLYECHIMQVLCNLGYTNTAIGPLMDELISSRGSCYIPSVYPSTKEAVRVIKDVGGIAVVAHPEQFDSFGLVEEYAKKGWIQGVEVCHPRNSLKARERLKELADKYSLLTTGGSDFHGQYAKNPHPLGACGCTVEEAECLLAYK